MINIPTPAELLAFQIEWYTNRLKEETRPESRSFLRKTLYNLKKKPNEKSNGSDVVFLGGCTPCHSRVFGSLTHLLN